MPDPQKQFDFPRGAQLAALRALRVPDGISRDGSKVRASTLLAVLRVLDDRIGKNGTQWWDQATIGQQAGISSRTVSKAMQVLESMRLIEKIDTRRGGARRLVISIDWQTVFADGEPFQDPTILAAWGLFEPAAEPGFNSELAEFNSELASEFNSELCSQLIRNPVPNSLLSKATKNPLTLSEGGRVREFDSQLMVSEEPAMPTRTIDPRERELIRRLVDLGVGSAAGTLREALRIGYSCEAVAGILDWFEEETLTDPATGERVRPYYVGQLVGRLRDEHATEARPNCGKWGGRTAEWSALKLRLSGPKAGPARVPDHSLARRSGIVERLDRAEVIYCLEVLASGDGPDVPRAVKCLSWVLANWAPDLNPLIPPAAVFRFLMQFDVAALLTERKKLETT